MDKNTALSLALATLQALPQLIQLTQEASNLINQSIKIIKQAQDENRDPTDAEWETFNSIVDSLIAQRNEAIAEKESTSTE